MKRDCLNSETCWMVEKLSILSLLFISYNLIIKEVYKSHNLIYFIVIVTKSFMWHIMLEQVDDIDINYGRNFKKNHYSKEIFIKIKIKLKIIYRDEKYI